MLLVALLSRPEKPIQRKAENGAACPVRCCMCTDAGAQFPAVLPLMRRRLLPLLPQLLAQLQSLLGEAIVALAGKGWQTAWQTGAAAGVAAAV